MGTCEMKPLLEVYTAKKKGRLSLALIPKLTSPQLYPVPYMTIDTMFSTFPWPIFTGPLPHFSFLNEILLDGSFRDFSYKIFWEICTQLEMSDLVEEIFFIDNSMSFHHSSILS